MPPGRRTRGGLAHHENDENAGSTRMMTRAKAAALNVDELAMPSQPLGQNKAAANANVNPHAGHRKRSALGDVSNVGKAEVLEGKKATASSKVGLGAKASQPSRVQKSSTTTTAASRRVTATSKEHSKKETSRAGRGDITAGKRKVSRTTKAAAKEGTPAEEGEPVRKKAHTAEKENRHRTNVDEIATRASIEVKTDAEDEAEEEDDVKEETGWQGYPPGVADLDTEDLDDPVMVAEYANDIFMYLRELETQTLANPDYINLQDELEWKTRGILVDWLVEVHTRFHLLPETLFLAINIIDRFLSLKIVQLDRLQLVGVTALFIASKYEEVLSPHVSNFVHVADDGFTESEILSAERFILSTLDYNLSYPNPMNFLRRISKADSYDIQCRTIGKYLMEISLLDHRFMEFCPSHVAAAAMYLGRLILDRGEWDATLEYYSGYSEEKILPVVHLMIDYLVRPVVHEAFFKKYASKKFLKASIQTRQWAKKSGAFMFEIEHSDLSVDQIS